MANINGPLEVVGVLGLSSQTVQPQYETSSTLGDNLLGAAIVFMFFVLALVLVLATSRQHTRRRQRIPFSQSEMDHWVGEEQGTRGMSDRM